MACGTDAAGGKGLQESGLGRGGTEEVRLTERNHSATMQIHDQDMRNISLTHLTEGWKAKLSSYALFAIYVDSDQVLTEWPTARDVDYGH